MIYDPNFKNLILEHPREALGFHAAAAAQVVARLNLPNMAYDPTDKNEAYARAVRGLLELEPDPEQRPTKCKVMSTIPRQLVGRTLEEDAMAIPGSSVTALPRHSPCLPRRVRLCHNDSEGVTTNRHPGRDFRDPEAMENLSCPS